MTRTIKNLSDFTPELLESAAREVAQQRALERGCRHLPHGSRLFYLEKGWESQIVARDTAVAHAESLGMLEAMLRNPEVKVVFIPHSAGLDDEHIERLCERNAATKTLFKEV